MGQLEIIEEALRLAPQERFIIIDTLLKSLDKPDSEIEKIWDQEVEQRVQHYKKNKSETIPFEKVFS